MVSVVVLIEMIAPMAGLVQTSSKVAVNHNCFIYHDF